mgnify:CR=1 FL=1
MMKKLTSVFLALLMLNLFSAAHSHLEIVSSRSNRTTTNNPPSDSTNRCSGFFAENAISAQPIPPAARLMGEALPEAWNSFIDRIERKESIS